jgi:hypothetical protein
VAFRDGFGCEEEIACHKKTPIKLKGRVALNFLELPLGAWRTL